MIPPTTYDPPAIMHKDNVMFWEAKSRGLLDLKKEGDKKSATLLEKAKKILENNCIVRQGFGKWTIKPIKNYNVKSYLVYINDSNNLVCNCQGCNRNGYCSHILAVKQFIFIESYNQGEICL